MAYDKELEVLRDAIRQAGQAVQAITAEGFETARKANQDPVTTGDLAADGILKQALLGAFPDDGWLSEETVDDPSRTACRRVWIVDPIDGTKEYVTGIPEYSVSVALAEQGQVVTAGVFNPSTDCLYSAVAGGGAWCNGEPVRVVADVPDRPVLLASRSEIQRGEWAPFEAVAEVRPCGSIAYKLALIAAGEADATFSLGPKNEWDIAAGVLLIAEAGGKVADCADVPFTFNQPQTLVGGIVAASHAAYYPVRSLIEQSKSAAQQEEPR